MPTFQSRRRFAASTIAIASLQAVLMLGGCAGQQARLSESDRDSLATHPKVYAVRHKTAAGFSYESTGYALAGALLTPLVAIAQAGEGMGLQGKYQLEDPVGHVQERLIEAIHEKFRVANVQVVETPPASDLVPSLLQAYPGAVVLDIRTLKWGIDNNRAVYQARARILRTSKLKDILWQGTCSATADKDKTAPTTEALKADGGILLKSKILDAATECADQLVGWLTAGKP